MRKCILFIVTVFTHFIQWGQSEIVPAPRQAKSVLIMNATAHLGNGQKIDNSAIGFRDGKLDLVADATVIRLNMSAYDTVIYASGMHVYPGFIGPNSTLGLHEIDAVRAMDDVAEVGTFKPSVRSAIAYNAESEIIPTTRNNGVLLAQIAPRGGIVSGTSSVMQLDAWNWEDAIVREDDGIHVNWPQVFHKHFDKGKVSIEKVKSYEQQRKEIELFFTEAKTYCGARLKDVVEMRYEAMCGLFDGTKTLYVHADDVKSITEAVYFKNQLGIKSMVLVGGYDAWQVAELLRNNDVGVMLNRVHSLPYLNEDDIDLPFRMAAMLYERGVAFCFQNEGDMERMQLRNLPFLAGTAVAYGLPYEQAVKALTLAPATLLGIASYTGSLEVGKDATLFISQGDALDVRTNALTAAWINGRWIDLRSKHTLLYDKYNRKYTRP
jgi:imidazolonepropionase-like amidohydrolase